MVLVKEVMNKDVSIISKNSSAIDAAKKMTSKGISCLIVSEGEKIDGIITRRDIFEKVLVLEKDVNSVKVCEIMSFPVETIDENNNLIVGAGIMNTKHIKQIPVVQAEKLVGIITQTDVVRNINMIAQFDVPNL